ncbi:MAG TPA: VOC family protein [Polyangiaceae bacterium]|jgi:catechol 2,3-dioxygenase-like lactoylglutathione lyase family enzyme|nr:VOC family protein [Polyangiaceae bacterium]
MKLTPNLIVDSIEACLPFWVDRLGFEKTVEVPHEGALGFVILVRDGVELMLQSRASLATDVPPLEAGPHRATLYFTVPDLAPIRAALAGYPLAVPERTTFYGARELIVKDPAGNGVCFGAH